MKRQAELVSVVIAAYNAEATIVEQLEALERQSYDDAYEVIVADNGSTDSTVAVVDAFARCSPVPVHVADASDARGCAHARNVGAQAARGDLLAFCDADDIVSPDWLARLATAAGDADQVTGSLSLREINDSGGTAARRDQLEAPEAHGRPYAYGGNGAIWRHTFLALDGFDEALDLAGEDIDLSLRLQTSGGSIGFVPDAVIHYRVRPTASRLFRQFYGYGRAEVDIFCRHAVARRPASEVARFLAYIGMRWPLALVSKRIRNQWLMWSGAQAGRIVGSVRHRVIYL